MTQTTANGYEQLEQQSMQWIEELVVGGKFLTAIRNGELTREQIDTFSLQYGHHRGNFHTLLGAAISRSMPDERWWAPLVDNLYDECGRGVPGQGHGGLYNTYLRSVIPDAEINAMGNPAVPCAEFIFGYNKMALDFLKDATAFEAFGYMGPGNELLTIPMYSSILEGLKGHDFDLNFWTVHIEDVEEEHYGSLKAVLSEYDDEGSLSQIREGARKAIEHQQWFWDEMYKVVVGS